MKDMRLTEVAKNYKGTYLKLWKPYSLCKLLLTTVSIVQYKVAPGYDQARKKVYLEWDSNFDVRLYLLPITFTSTLACCESLEMTYQCYYKDRALDIWVDDK